MQDFKTSAVLAHPGSGSGSGVQTSTSSRESSRTPKRGMGRRRLPPGVGEFHRHQALTGYWVAVEELKLNYHNMDMCKQYGI